MAIAFRSKNSASGATNSLVITKPAGTVAGDVLVAYIARQYYASAANSVTPPAGWNGLFDSTYSADPPPAPGEAVKAFYKVAGGSEPANYTFSLGETRSCVGVILAYSGASAYNPLDSTGEVVNNTDDNATISFPTISNTYANAMLVTCCSADIVSGTVSTPSGQTSRHNELAAASGGFRTVMGVSDQFVSGAGTNVNVTYTSDDTTVSPPFNFRVNAGKQLFLKTNIAPNTPTVLSRTSANTDLTPVFSVRISDIDTSFGGAQPIKARFEIYKSDGVTFVGSVDSSTVTTYDIGQQYATVTAEYTPALLPDNYKVRAKTIDDEPLESSYTSFVDFDLQPIGVVSMGGTGDLSSSGALTTTVASALLTGFGDLSAEPFVANAAGIRPTIGSKAPMLDDTKNRLGCGTAGAFITGKCGFPTVCVLDNIEEVEWDRRLDEVSQATVKIGLSGGSDGACCECLNEIEPWCHELHITRNGVEQWVGPITRVVYSFNEVIISAIDVIGWLGVKVPAADTTFAVATNLTTIAYGSGNSIFNVAMVEEAACFLDAANFSAFPNAITGIRTYKAYGATSLDYLNDLAHSGLNYTTLGRRVVLSGEITQLTPLIILRDENILGEVEVVKDGLLAGNRYYVHYKNDLGVPAVYTHPTPYCYGRIEKMLTADGITTVANAQAMATQYANATYVAPRTIEVPSGSRLHPDTPWTISEMVCGARVDVQLSGLCFKIEQSFTLNQMKLIENASEGEQVLITLVPINSVGVS